jgi:hypothetical protein
LQNYTAHLAARAEPAVEQPGLESARAAASHGGQSSAAHGTMPHGHGVQPLSVSRRPTIDLTLPLTATGPLTGAGVGAVSGAKSPHLDEALELGSPLDVPAFLRRQG